MSSSSDNNNNNNNSDTRDPSGFLKLDSSGRPAHLNGNESPTVVKIIGTARDDLNGLLGFCTAYNRDRERYMVTMASVDVSTSPNATVMALKPDNLTKASTIETYKAQFQALRTDPRVRQRLTEYYNWAGKYCHPYKVEHAAATLAIFLVLLMYFFGFTKTVMLVSAVVMVFCILVEDVIRTRKPWREVVRNFPSRSKSVIERQFPFLRGKLSENVAAGLVGVLIAFTVQSVFFTTTTSNNNTNQGASTSYSQPPPASRIPQRSMASVSQLQHRERLEEIYHLGFQDSLDGKDRGHSLAAKLDALLADTPVMEDLDPIPEIPYSATPLTRPPPPKTFANRLFSMRTMGSIFYLYRMAMQIGIDPSTGIFSVAQLGANIQHRLPTWQKGMLAFSVYNLFSNLFL
mmetsp:Transcript_20437/g.42084  ORF Transcript_20437/g.42084 Transcript_20437/m.42084 type:complete len:403 (+) Transcript_20437:95-1303(+)